MTHMVHPNYIELVRTLITNPDSWEIHSFTATDNGTIDYGDAEVHTLLDGYVVSWTDCSNCTGAHISCRVHETFTKDAYEALELASVEGYRK